MTEKVRNMFVGALRWSERYIKTDMVYLVSGSFWVLAGQGISSLSALALAIALGNLLPQQVYGTYKYVLSIAAIFAVFALPGMATSYSRATAQGKSSSIRAATAMRLRYAALGALGALAGSGYYFIHGNKELAISLLIIAATLPFVDTFTLYASYLVGIRRFDIQAKLYALTQTLSVGCVITTAFFTKSVPMLLLAYFVPLAIARFVLYCRALRIIPKENNEIQEKETLSYGRHLTFMSVLGVVAGNIDKILLWQFLGPAEVAIYTFAVAIPEQLKGPLIGMSNLAFPKYAQQSPKEIRENFPSLWRKLVLYAIGLLMIAVIYFFTAPFIFKTLFPKYVASVVYSQVFMLSVVGLVGTIPLTILAAHKKIKEQYVFFTSQPALQIVLYLILVPIWGIMGAIVARVIMRMLYIVQSVIMLNNSFSEKDTGSNP